MYGARSALQLHYLFALLLSLSSLGTREKRALPPLPIGHGLVTVG